MNDDRLGMAAGAWLRDIDRPTADPVGTLTTVMAQVRATPQRRRRRWPWQRQTPTLNDTVELGLDQPPTYPVNGHQAAPAPPAPGGTRTMVTASSLAVAGIGAVAVGAFLASGALAPDAATTPGAGTAEPGIGWTTERARLLADDMTLEVNGLEFGNVVWPAVKSDSGSAERWTLEVDWTEHELEQRLYLYFGADETDWWIDEIRTRDGYDPAEWVFAYGPFLRTPLGEAFEGDFSVELVGEGRPEDPDNVVVGQLSFKDMRLAVSPSDKTQSEILLEQADGNHEDMAATDAAADNAGEVYGPDEYYPSEAVATVDRALQAAIEEGACLSIDEAQTIAMDVLAKLEVSGWTIEVRKPVWEDGCAWASADDVDPVVSIDTGLRPDVIRVLDEFTATSLEECFDATTAVETLTEALEAVGHTDFDVRLSDMVGGPAGSEAQVAAQLDAGCVFYVGSGANEDGRPLYFLHDE